VRSAAMERDVLRPVGWGHRGLIFPAGHTWTNRQSGESPM
jgi:hypothetical protein